MCVCACTCVRTQCSHVDEDSARAVSAAARIRVCASCLLNKYRSISKNAGTITSYLLLSFLALETVDVMSWNSLHGKR